MNHILHRIEVESSPAATYAALTDASGWSGWWTAAESDPRPDGQAVFRFGPGGENQVTMAYTELEPERSVRFRCIDGPWVGTGEFQFDIEPHARGSVIRFSHRDWPEADDFFRHCNAKWGFFLAVSLKQYLETGTGQPHPADPSI